MRDPGLVAGKTDPFKRVLDPPLHLSFLDAEVDRTERHVITEQGHEQHVIRVLKDDTDLLWHLVYLLRINGLAEYLDCSKRSTAVQYAV